MTNPVKAWRLDALNYRLRHWLRLLAAAPITSYAFLTRKRFYCHSLTGLSTYDTAINSDMTVTCNCKDMDGVGVIGSLARQSFEQIWSGPKATMFRRKLAEGKLPIRSCVTCAERRLVSRQQAEHYRDHYELPRLGLMVENTVVCCYRCLSCARPVVYTKRARKAMSMEDIGLVSQTMRRIGVKTCYFFNLGDPFCHPEVNAQTELIRRENPDLFIYTSTYGVMLRGDDKLEAALRMNHLVFSIDGTDDEIMQRYQRGANFDRAYQNMCRVIQTRNQRGLKAPRVEWKYVLFNWNDRPAMIHRAIALAKAAAVDVISFWPARYPVYGISWRYFLSPFFRSLGTKSWKGREVIFTPEA